ncbi:MAG: 2-phospho-L-lactate transferase [Promethearchaeota archaeon]
MEKEIYVVLAGGVGAAKFIQGLAPLVEDWQLKIIVNTGDDIELFGLKICPDLDIITYSLANLIDKNKGWGYKDETFNCLSALKNFYDTTWFNLGDKDLATHVYRTHLFREGYTKTEITKKICEKLGIKQEILPMCDENVETIIYTSHDRMHFEEFYIKYQCQPAITKIEFEGIKNASLSEEIKTYIEKAKKIIICPSNPIVSIGTILSVGDMKKILSIHRNKVHAISPIVNNAPIKGPADKLMKLMNLEVSCVGVATFYKDFVGNFIIDIIDKDKMPEIEALNMNVSCFDTLMTNQQKKEELANHVLNS